MAMFTTVGQFPAGVRIIGSGLRGDFPTVRHLSESANLLNFTDEKSASVVMFPVSAVLSVVTLPSTQFI